MIDAELLKIINKILSNQMDPATVMAKLDEIIANQKKQSEAIGQIRQKTWQSITDTEITQAASELLAFAGQKVSIVVSNPEGDRIALAQQLATIFKTAKWDLAGIRTPMVMFAGNTTEFPHGIIVRVGQNSPAASLLAKILINLFGRTNVGGFNDPKLDKDQIEISIWPKTR